jgi:tetratricopeptide (TPR) repeat protein
VGTTSLFAARPADEEYEVPLARLEAKLPRLLAREDGKVRRALALLTERGAHKLPRGRFPRMVAYRAYREKSWSLRHEDPARMLEFARLALQEAEQLEIEAELGWARSRDLAARAWAELANALRIIGRFDEADQAFAMAAQCFRMGTGDERLEALLHTFRASYYGDRRSFPLALESIEAAIGIYSRLDDPHALGKVLLMKGFHVGEVDDLRQAVELTRRGLALIDREQEPSLHYAAVHNLAWWLLESDDLDAARAVLARYPIRPEQAPGRAILAKQRWAEARLALGSGDAGQAERSFAAARGLFLETGRPYPAAIVSIDLAALYFKLGRLDESKALALEASEELANLGIHREAWTAILMLIKALQAGTATVQLIEGAAKYLKQGEMQPRFALESST